MTQARDGPVQFEKDTSNADDPFHIGDMIRDVTESASGAKKHGRQESQERQAKKSRLGDDE